MIRRTFGQAKAQLARIAGATGMIMSDSRVMDYTNQAIEELMQEGDWPSIVDRYAFRVYGGTITLPQNFERPLYMTLNGQRQQMQSPWYEFLGYGPGFTTDQPIELQNLQNELGLLGVIDREDVCVYLDIPDPLLGTLYTLYVQATTTEEANTTIIIQGLDGNREWIRSQFNGEWIDGVAFVLAGSPQHASSAQVFSKITAVIKPETNQPVNCYIVPVGGVTQTQIARWEAAETNPSYRRYRIPGLCDSQQYCVDARVRRRFAPITADEDVMLIGNLPALKNMVQAVYYAEANEKDSYGSSKAIAVDILKKEAKAYIGLQNQKPLITFTEGLAAPRRGLYVQ